MTTGEQAWVTLGRCDATGRSMPAASRLFVPDRYDRAGYLRTPHVFENATTTCPEGSPEDPAHPLFRLSIPDWNSWAAVVLRTATFKRPML